MYVKNQLRACLSCILVWIDLELFPSKLQLLICSTCYLFRLIFQEISCFFTLKSLIIAHKFSSNEAILRVVPKALNTCIHHKRWLLAARSFGCRWFLANTWVATPSSLSCRTSGLSFIAYPKYNPIGIIHHIHTHLTDWCINHFTKLQSSSGGCFHHLTCSMFSVIIVFREKRARLAFHKWYLAWYYWFGNLYWWSLMGISPLSIDMRSSQFHWCLIQWHLFLMICFTS